MEQLDDHDMVIDRHEPLYKCCHHSVARWQLKVSSVYTSS